MRLLGAFANRKRILSGRHQSLCRHGLWGFPDPLHSKSSVSNRIVAITCVIPANHSVKSNCQAGVTTIHEGNRNYRNLFSIAAEGSVFKSSPITGPLDELFLPGREESDTDFLIDIVAGAGWKRGWESTCFFGWPGIFILSKNAWKEFLFSSAFPIVKYRYTYIYTLSRIVWLDKRHVLFYPTPTSFQFCKNKDRP